MSEEGWIEFLRAGGVEDWVVLHVGATAVFRVGSLGEPAGLANAIARVPVLEGSRVLITMGPERATVRLTRGVFRIETTDVRYPDSLETTVADGDTVSILPAVAGG